MTSKALISTIIPTYYRDESLRNAIQSVLNQTYENVEIIVVDDSGEGYAQSVVDEFEVQYIQHKTNKGGNPARNTGLGAASGMYVQFLDDDDELLPTKFEKQVELLEGGSDVGVAYGGITDRKGSTVLPDPDFPDRALWQALQLTWPTAITSSLLIKRWLLDEISPLQRRKAADDIGMKIELAKHTEFGYVNEVLTKLGDSPDSRSKKSDFPDELANIISTYENLYAGAPESVRRTALTTMYKLQGYSLLKTNMWDHRAILALAKANYYRDVIDVELLGGLAASLFGNPGMKLASYAYERVKTKN